MRKFLTFLMLTIYSSFSFAANPIIFEGFIAPGTTATFPYSFFDGVQTHPQMICYNGIDEANSLITYPYAGMIQPTQPLPVLLTIDSRYSGFAADINGTIILTNTTLVGMTFVCGYTY